MHALRRAGLLLALAALTTVACGTSGPPARAADPTVEEVRAYAAGYLRDVKAEVVSITVEKHHVGLYVRGVPEWTLDQFVEHLPLAAETARAMLARWTSIGDVDLCADGPWLPHDEYDDFATASRVQLYRDRLDRVPARFATPADVMHAGGTVQSIDYYLDTKIVTGSARYRTEAKAAIRTTPSPS